MSQWLNSQDKFQGGLLLSILPADDISFATRLLSNFLRLGCLASLSPLALIALPEAESGVEQVQAQHCQDDHEAFQPDKEVLRLDQVPFPAFTKFCNTIR